MDLIELLVAIASVAMRASLLLPTSNGFRGLGVINFSVIEALASAVQR